MSDIDQSVDMTGPSADGSMDYVKPMQCPTCSAVLDPASGGVCYECSQAPPAIIVGSPVQGAEAMDSFDPPKKKLPISVDFDAKKHSIPIARNVAFYVCVIALVLALLTNFMGAVIMWGGHGGIPHVKKMSDSTGSDLGAVYDKGNRLALSGWAAFYVLVPPIIYVIATIFRATFLFDIATAHCVVLLILLMVAAEQMDRVTFNCRDVTDESLADDDIKKACSNSRNAYMTGVFFCFVAHLILLHAGLFQKWLMSGWQTNFCFGLKKSPDADESFDQSYGQYPPHSPGQQASGNDQYPATTLGPDPSYNPAVV